MITAAFAWTGALVLVLAFIGLGVFSLSSDAYEYKTAKVAGIFTAIAASVAVLLFITAIWNHALTGGN